jgi:hypothetical protein
VIDTPKVDINCIGPTSAITLQTNSNVKQSR